MEKKRQSIIHSCSIKVTNRDFIFLLLVLKLFQLPVICCTSMRKIVPHNITTGFNLIFFLIASFIKEKSLLNLPIKKKIGWLYSLTHHIKFVG